MKSFNLIYRGEGELKNFLKKHSLNENVFVQIFTGILDRNIIQNLINLLKQEIKNIKIIGASTDGEIINGKVTSHEIILNFNIFDDTKVETIILEKDNNKSFDLGIKIATNLIEEDSKVLFTFVDGLNVNGEEFIKGIKSVNNVIIAGGLAGDNGKFESTFVFNEDRIISKGCVGAVLNSKILKVNTEYGFNWEGIGKIMSVTKSQKNIVYEIDGKTPVELYRYYFGKEIAKDVVKIGVEFPLLITKNDVKLARAVVGQNLDGSLIFAGNVNEGDLVQFGYGNIEEILKKDDELFNSISKFDIESIFIYSCMARRRFMGEKINYEIAPFGQVADVSGFFTYGEFFSHNNENIFFNQTMTVLVLSEKENKKKRDIEYKNNLETDEIQTFKALTNLIKATSKEIVDLNKTLEEKVKQKTKQLKAKNIELEYMYYHDSLTGLPNKHMLDKDLMKQNYGGLLIDIKQFSSINDLYGEFIGDEILKRFTNIINQISQEYGTKLYRVGADQFIILNFNDNNIIEQLSTILFYSINNEHILVEANGNTLSIGLNIRIAWVDKNGKNIKVKLDLALNYAKKNSFDCVKYDENLKLEEKLAEELLVIERVKEAIKNDNIVPVFQRITKEEGDSYECLVRMKEGNNLISPFFFLETIEHTNYYFTITKIMIDKSFRIFKDRKEMISINFSYKDINNEEIVDYLIYKIKEYKMHSRVIVEFLESENLDNFNDVKKFIEKVKEYGVRIAIDDFGSGYSNFIYLASIKPDYIKIDGSLIKNINNDKNSFIITKNINNFAKELGCKTIAEFVHNKEVFDIVKSIEIDGIQGYFIHQPSEEV